MGTAKVISAHLYNYISRGSSFVESSFEFESSLELGVEVQIIIEYGMSGIRCENDFIEYDSLSSTDIQRYSTGEEKNFVE